MSSPVLRAPVFLLAGCLLLACGSDPDTLRESDPRPNLLVISMDTTRADHLSVYGYARETSASLRRLAAEGVRFDSAYSPTATTGPSHASLFTSLYPMTHQVLKNGHVLAPGYETLAEILATAGYDTAAVVSSYVLNRKFGYEQGFASYDDDVSQADTPSGTVEWEGEIVEGKFYGRADDTTRRARDWLARRPHPERPFFLFVHYFDPHDPYVPPAEYRPPFELGREMALKLERTIAFYDTEIAYTDEQIGHLLGALSATGLAEGTVVVVLGDHGEGLMQHGHMHHGVHIYEEAVRVPLIVRWPGHLAPRIEKQPVQILDLAPTLLALTGTEQAGAHFQGRSIASLLRAIPEGGREPGERPVYLYRRHYSGAESAQGELADGIVAKGEKFGLRLGDWKLIEGPEEESLELFDLAVDPGETRNRALTEPERLREMRAGLADWRRLYGDAGASEPRSIDDEDRARLEALGYAE
jgi:arylsulfatase A-like enzyme